MQCSQAAIDLIWAEEAGGDAYYVKSNECKADWPGGASGVTIGAFYDLGYVSPGEFRQDWGDKLPASMVAALLSVIGIKGFPARSHARELDSVVNIPEAIAKDVFTGREIPKWEAVVAKLPNADKLPADCFGALVSIAMNRGDGFDAPADGPNGRYYEMRLIKLDMAAQRFSGIPSLIRSMQRLWPKDGDLWNRREAEAKLFEQGLRAA